MSQYKTHTKFNLLLALPLLLAGLFYFIHPRREYAITFASTFVYSTLFMNPDMDLAHQIKLRSLRGVLSLPFRLYSRVFKHRGLSHSLVFGSLTRIVWLSAIALLIFYLTNQILPSKTSFVKFFHRYEPFILFGFFGVFIADLCHLLLDMKRK